MVEPRRDAGERASRRSQFDALWAVYERFNAELLKCGDPHAVELAQGWIMAKAKYAEWVDLKAKVPRSSIATGLKQGLRETPRILHGFPDPIREHLLKAFQRILLEEAPDFFPDEGNKLVGIVKRGRIRNEDEYYLVRHRADEIEGRVAHEDEVAVLLRLLDGYEGVR